MYSTSARFGKRSSSVKSAPGPVYSRNFDCNSRRAMSVVDVSNMEPNTSGDLVLRRRDGAAVELPIVAAKTLKPRDNAVTSIDVYDMDAANIGNLYERSLKSEDFMEFNNYQMLKNAGGSEEKTYHLVDKSTSRWVKFLSSTSGQGRNAAHLTNLMVVVVPSVPSDTPGTVSLTFHDGRFTNEASLLAGVVQKVGQAKVYLITTGYSVPLEELDFQIRVSTRGVPLKVGKTAVWARAAWNLGVSQRPVYVPKTLALTMDVLPGQLPMEKLAIEAALEEASGMRRSSFSVEGGPHKGAEGGEETPPMGRYLDDQLNTVVERISENSSEKSENHARPEISLNGPFGTSLKFTGPPLGKV